ncbi:MAG: TonB-dependent receptor [Alphaproteobacteria bacterium]
MRQGYESPIRIPAERQAYLGRTQFDFTNNLRGFVEVNYAHRKNVYDGNSQGPQSFFQLSTSNAYLQCSNYTDLSNAQRATLALRQANCKPVTILAPAGTTIQTTNRIGVYGAGELDGSNRLLAARAVPITDLPSRQWNALRTDANTGERYLAPAATVPYTAQTDFASPTIGLFAWAKHMQLAARPLNTSSRRPSGSRAALKASCSTAGTGTPITSTASRKIGKILNNTRTDIFFKSAIDAVFAPDGSIQCNILVDPNHPNNPNNPKNVNDPALNAEYSKCAPLNLIGLTESNGRLTPEALAYSYRTQQNNVEYEQQIAGGTSAAICSKAGPGPIGAALGLEARREVGAVTHGEPFPAYYRYFSRPQLGYPYSGELEIYEGYAEVNVPLLRDLPLVDNLEVGGAYRRTQQTNSDTTPGFEASKELRFSTWKANVDWALTDWARFRGTRSRDVRAAGFRDLTFKGTPNTYGTTEGRLSNPWPECNTAGRVGNCNEDFAIVTPSGNFTLEPEEGDTTTLGLVFSPGSWASGFRVSVDHYKIEIAKAISTGGGGITAQGLINQCRTSGTFCEFVQQDVGGSNSGPFVTATAGTPVTDIGTVRPISLNLGGFLQRGWDINIEYNTDVDRFIKSWRGNLSFRSIFSYVYDFTVDPNSTVAGDEVNYAGQSANPTGIDTTFGDFVPGPKWRSSHYITYSLGGFASTLGFQYIGSGKYNALWQQPGDAGYDPKNDTSVNDNTVDKSILTSLAFSYEFHPFRNPDASSEMFLAMDNIFGNDPPIAPSGVGFPTNPTYFDTQGARWRAGLRVKF